MKVDSTLEKDIPKGQLEDAKIQEIKEQNKEGKAPGFSVDEQGTLWYKKHLCIPELKETRELILHEGHDAKPSKINESVFTQEVPRCTVTSRVDIGGME
jgi:hypothetical protein